MKNFAIIDSENKEIITAIQKHFGGNIPVLSVGDSFEGYDLLVLTGYESSFQPVENVEIINLHPTLLPSFQGADALKQAFLSGVKVSGITVHKVEKNNFYGKILAQYPVLIGAATNFSDYVEELEIVAKKLYPMVIDSIINDKVFDFHDLFNCGCSKNGCSGNCGNCS